MFQIVVFSINKIINLNLILTFNGKPFSIAIFQQQKMLKKFLMSDKKSASELLHKINVSEGDARYLTEYSDLFQLSKTHNNKAPQPKSFIKHMKKNNFSVGYLLKCSVIVHFFIQNGSSKDIANFTDFANILIERCNTMINPDSSGVSSTQPSILKLRVNTSYQGEFTMNKQNFFLREIIRPYLGYIVKSGAFRLQLSKNLKIEGCEAWRAINLLNMIRGFAINFTIVGRYFIHEYGALVVLLSQALAVDIKQYYEMIGKFVRQQEKYICVRSGNREEQREAEEFGRLLEEIGFINQKFNQFYMSKYFYHFLEHLEQPDWIDTNSPEFDRIFHGSNKQNCEQRPNSQIHKSQQNRYNIFND